MPRQKKIFWSGVILGVVVVALLSVWFIKGIYPLYYPDSPYKTAGTPIPPNLQIITRDNVSRLEPISKMGNGEIINLSWIRGTSNFAVESADGIHIYSSTSLKETKYFPAGTNNDWRLIPEQNLLIRNAKDGYELLSLKYGTMRNIYGAEEFIALSLDGSVLATSSGEKPVNVFVWNSLDGSLVSQFTVEDADWIYSAAISKDNQFIIISPGCGGDCDAKMQINRIADGELIFVNNYEIYLHDQVTVSPDRILFAYTFSRELSVYKLQDDNLIKVVDLIPMYEDHDKDWINHVVFSPDGEKLAASTGEGSISIWRTSDWSLISNLQSNHGQAEYITFSDDGEKVVASYLDGIVMVLNIRTGLSEGAINGFSKFLENVDETYISPDGKYIASVVSKGVNEGEYLEFWDAQTGKLLDSSDSKIKGFRSDVKDILSIKTRLISQLVGSEKIEEYHLWSYEISPDKKNIATGEFSGAVRLWNYKDLSIVKELPQHPGGVIDLAFSADGTLLASAMERNPTVNIWQISDAQMITSITTESEYHNSSIAFSPDGNLLVIGNQGGEIRFWSVRDGKMIYQMTSPNSSWISNLRFSPKGDFLMFNNIFDKVIWIFGIR